MAATTIRRESSGKRYGCKLVSASLNTERVDECE